MSNSESIPKLKIPYATEGVIRTAAIDDTVAPDDSCQIAVNMNFDRIGAFQTRLGLTEYADDLDGEIKNFGTLNASVIPDGFTNIFQFPSNDNVFEFTEAEHLSSLKVDEDHVLVFWKDSASDGNAQVMEINPATGVMTAIGSPVVFDAANGAFNASCQVDANHFINFWQGASNDGFVQVFEVNLTTFAVTDLGTPLEFDTSNYQGGSCVKIDATHIINFWDGAGGAGLAQVFLLDGSYTVTAIGSPLTVDAGNGGDMSAVRVEIDHYLLFWNGTAGGQARVFEVDLGTYAVTGLSTALLTDAVNANANSAQFIATDFYLNFWGNGTIGKSAVFGVNPSTFEVVFADPFSTFSATDVSENSLVSAGDGIHFINFWKDAVSNEGYTQIFEIVGSDAVPVGDPKNFGTLESGSPDNLSAVLLSGFDVALSWVKATDGADGIGVMTLFALRGDFNEINFLYAQEEDGDVLNWDNPGWTVRRTGVNPSKKARFMQYLNLIWMVNGNEVEGGDPVMTSDGGNFDTTMVPDDFPPGDFIQGGFEGRVWVVDALSGVVYFTDVVQFTPPDTYTLTYNAEFNFIKNFSPQNGQNPTGLFVTPRALLLFQQDFIYRIYGAFSVDNYPAYNVGTYSQESIVQTKDGIYFHHSSGFYKFQYDGQPLEISRRIIDFVQAIPRSYYENVTAIYDGFDAVEWCIGPVTVEGVTFTNCFVRYTISTQIWTIYDYPENDTTALITYDDGDTINMIMGTDEGRVNKMDDGFDDLGEPIYYEFIDRWRGYTELYAKSKSIAGLNIYNKNGAGANISFQTQDAPPNVWEPVGVVDENACSLIPTVGTDDFNAGRIRIAGFSKGTPVVFHGIEILSLDDKGYDKN